MPSAYDLVKNWRLYHQATQSSRNGVDIPFSTYGVMGTPGFSSGAFLKSPYCRSSDPDIQLTFFPSVCDEVFIFVTWFSSYSYIKICACFVYLNSFVVF